jgi:hypothetical protein
MMAKFKPLKYESETHFKSGGYFYEVWGIFYERNNQPLCYMSEYVGDGYGQLMASSPKLLATIKRTFTAMAGKDILTIDELDEIRADLSEVYHQATGEFID